MGIITTSHYEIFEHWKDKKFSDLMELDDFSQDSHIVSNWEFPCCWACGKEVFFHDSDIDELLSIKGNGLKNLWNSDKTKSKLQRCHILAASLGGEDVPSNLFLLCDKCHIESPDTVNATNFYRWVIRKRREYLGGYPSPQAMFDRIDEDLKGRGCPGLKQILEKIDTSTNKVESLKEYMMSHVGLHWTSISELSIQAGLTDWILSEWVTALLND